MKNNIVLQSALASLAHLFGRFATTLLMLVAISTFGANQTTDFLFLCITISFYFHGSIANAFNDTLSSRLIIENKIISYNTVLFYSFASTAITAVVIFFSKSHGIENDFIFIAASCALMAGTGMMNIRPTSILTANHDYYSPGISWSFRAIPVVILFLVYIDSKPPIAYFAACICIGDFLRFIYLNNKSKNIHFNSHAHHLKTSELFAINPYLLGTLVQGLNPLIDRYIATLGEDGAVTLLEAADRIFWPVTSTITIGMQSVLLVTLSNLYKEANITSNKFNKIIFYSFIAGCIGSLFLFLISNLLGTYTSHIDFIKINFAQIKTIRECLLYYIFLIPVITISTCSARILIITKKYFLILLLASISLFLNAILSYHLFLTIGIPGIAAGTLLSQIITSILCYIAAIIFITAEKKPSS